MGFGIKFSLNNNMPGNSGTKATFVSFTVYPDGLYRTNADFFKVVTIGEIL